MVLILMAMGIQTGVSRPKRMLRIKADFGVLIIGEIPAENDIILVVIHRDEGLLIVVPLELELLL